MPPGAGRSDPEAMSRYDFEVIWGFAAGIAVAACSAPSTFACLDDEACARDGQVGVCVESGYCAFAAGECESGLRYGVHADPSLAERCVGPSEPPSDAPVPEPTPAAADEGGDESGDQDGIDDDEPDVTCPDDWFDCGWTRRRGILVAYDGEPLSDFPVLVVLDDERIDFQRAAADGADVRFVLDGEVLAHETVAWQPGGTTELWVRIPELAESTELQMYYGNPDATDASDPSAVWINEYLAVLHLDDETDSLAALDLESEGPHPVPGMVGTGMELDGTGGYLRDTGDPLPLFESTATVTVMFNASGWGESGYGRLFDASDTGDTETDTGYALSLTSAGRNLRFARGHDVRRGAWYSPHESVELDAWIVASVSYADGSGLKPQIWVDGEPSEVSEASAPQGAPVPAPVPLTIGAAADASSRYFDGIIDEIHIAATTRSDAWANAEHLSLTDDLLFFMAEERLP